MNPVKFERLPKWAQEHIENLTRTVREKDARLFGNVQSVYKGEVSNVELQGHWNEPNSALPDDSEIRFTLLGKNSVSVRRRVNEYTKDVYLYVSSNGCDPLLVKPRASNVVHIVIDRDRKLGG